LDVHAVYIPEVPVDIETEAKRLKANMDAGMPANIFLSEGAGVEAIVAEMQARGETPPVDAFGHVKLDAVNPGEWFANRFSQMIGAEKVMVQKSGYYSRAAPANSSDLHLIKSCCDLAVECASQRTSGVIGHDEDKGGKLRAIEFERIRGGKPFDITQPWYVQMMQEITSERIGYHPRMDSITAAHPAEWAPTLPAGMTLPKKVAILTAGGLAPCLSSSVGGLIERYSELYPSVELICYKNGYKGLLLGESVKVTEDVRRCAGLLHLHGGSPIGNSRVKLTNKKDCETRKLVKVGEDPQKVAADQLVKDKVEILHTVGGDDTNIAAADLAKYLQTHNYALTVIGLPKTIDNDVYPLQQTLGALTAAEEGARYFANVVYEHKANPRMLVVQEIMGRGCGYLTAATTRVYRDTLVSKGFNPGLGLSQKHLDVHAVFLPEVEVNIHAEAARLKQIMDEIECINLFISEGAGVASIVKEKEANGEELPRDAFGHVKLDAVKPGEWFGKQFAAMIGAEKVLVQKSGYYARSAPSNADDLRLIKSCTDHAVECAIRRESGVIGHDEDRGNVLRAIEFERIKGGKPFDIKQQWFLDMLGEMGQKLEYGKTQKVAPGNVQNLSIRINANVKVQSSSLFT